MFSFEGTDQLHHLSIMIMRSLVLSLLFSVSSAVCWAGEAVEGPGKFFPELIAGFLANLPDEGKAIQYTSVLYLGDSGGPVPALAGLEDGKISRVYRLGRTAGGGVFVVGKNIVKGKEQFIFALAISTDMLEFVDGNGAMFFSHFKTPKGVRALANKINTMLSQLDVPLFFALTPAVSDWEKAIESNLHLASASASTPEILGAKAQEYLNKWGGADLHDTIYAITYPEPDRGRKLMLSFDLSPKASPDKRITSEYRTLDDKPLFEKVGLVVGGLHPLDITSFATRPTISGDYQKGAFEKVVEIKKFASLREVIDTKTIFDSDAGAYLDE
jgi:hypothetical protein